MRKLCALFLSMLTISAFTFGGGFVIVSLMKRKFVEEKGWLTEEEMLDMTALAQSAPGPIAVNAAILAGKRIAGWPGLFAALLGALIPPVVIISLISLVYGQFAENEWVRAALSGMSCGVAAVIADVVAGLSGKIVKGKEWVSLAIMGVAFVLTCFLRVNVIWVILAAALIGVLRAILVKGGRQHAA